MKSNIRALFAKYCPQYTQYIRRAIRKLLVEHCPSYINWTMDQKRWNNITRIHRCYSHIVWRKNKIYTLTLAITWPFKTFGYALKWTSQYGPHITKQYGITKNRQFFDQLYYALRFFIPPRSYYLYKLYDPVNRDLSTMYIHHHEIIELLPGLNAHNDPKALDDKRRFFKRLDAQIFKRLDAQTAPMLIEFENGVMKRFDTNSDNNNTLPKMDLFAKPALGVNGRGTKLYTHKESHYYCDENDNLLTQDQVINQLIECSEDNPYILQKRIFNHPAITQLSTGALCTLRVVTCLPPDGPSEHLNSVFRMPVGKSISDNFSGGGIASPVEKSTGILGRAIAKDPASEYIDYHPDTDTKIVGFQIPFWNEIIQLCLKAHDAFPEFASVGWDVAITEDGPIFIEANSTWGVEIMQKAFNEPLGLSRFAEVFILHLNQQEHSKQAKNPGTQSKLT